MKIKNLFAVAALLMGSTSAFAQGIYSGNFKIQASATFAGKYEIVDFSNDFVIPEDGLVTIPATLTNASGADYQIVAIADDAFATFGDPSREIRLDIKGVSLAKEIQYIGENAFADFGNLATVTFAENSELTTIGDGAFSKDPMLKSISFANCPKLKYFTDNGKATDDATDPGNYTTPFVYVDATSDEVVANTRLTSITLNTNTIDFGTALANIENLATVNIKDTKIRTLATNALQGNKKITALELPAKTYYDTETGEVDRTEAVVLADNALNGTAIATLTINGNVVAGGIGALGVPMTTATTPAPALTTVTITGDVAAGGIKAGAFKDNTKLATVTIQGVVATGAVLAGAFENAGTAAPASTTGIKLTVTAAKAVVDAFAQNAFVVSDATTDVTPHDVSLALDPTIAVLPTIYRATLVAAPAAPGKIYVETNDNTTYFAKYNATAKISVKRGAGDVIVYSAYADGTNIYMDPLYSQADKYVFGATADDITANAALAKAQNVIIKVKGTSSLLKTDDEGKKYIEYEGAAATDAIGLRYLADATILNGIGYNAHITNQALNALASATTKVIYAVKKISTNGLKWGAIDNEGTFYINDAFYIEVDKPAASGRINVIWLDEEGNTTAIQKVETKSADSDAIYNLQGVRVNAAYKGVVIKNGKKFIQK